MGSRIKENPDQTFYWFFQASGPIARDKDPDVLFQFPEDFSDEESLQSLPHFCFPFDIERVKDSVAVQHFTFVLTDLEGCQRFGFCRLTTSSQTCLCILSYLPWFEVFYKLLNNLADYMTKGQINEMKELLTVLYKHPVPPANGSITLQMGGNLQIRSEMPGICGHTPQGEELEGIPYFIAPDPKALPSIPESRNLTELVVAVDVGNLLQLYASMLFERRILIYCSKLSTLTACVHACNSMLFPMYWQHIFIPVLPPHLLDYCCAPMPYLIGVHASLAERVRSRALEDVVILNVDTNTLESPHQDLKKIPADVVAGLKVRLKKQAALVGSGVSHAFLRAQALLFGGYRDALQFPADGQVVFCKELFLSHKYQSMREFLDSAVHLQCFKEFIDGRLEMLKQGKEPDDAFEREVLQSAASAAAGSNLYRQWVGNLKTKCHSKFGLKNLLSSKEQTDSHMLQRGGSVCGPHTYRLIQSDCLQNRLPITQHFGRSRPRRPARKHTTNQPGPPTSDNNTCEDSAAEEPELWSGSSQVQDDDDFSLMADPEEMDLLGEIFDTLSIQSSREPGLLYSTRSLDLFSSDSSEFISHRSLTTPSQESLSPSVGNSGSLMSWEEELEGPDGLRESLLLTDKPEKELDESKKSFRRFEESLCKEAQCLADASLDLKVDCKVQQEDHRLTHDGQVNGKLDELEESLDTGTIGGKRLVETETQTDNEEQTTEYVEQHQAEDKMTNDLESPNQKKKSLFEAKPRFGTFQEPTNGEIISPVSVNVKERSDKADEASVDHQSALPAVALFQQPLSQSTSPTYSAMPATTFRGLDHLQGTPLRSCSIHEASSRPATSMETDELHLKAPVTSTPKQLLAEEQDQAPIKVSELKKRFEH